LDDRRTQQFFLGGKHPKFNDILAVYNALEALRADEEAAPLQRVQEEANTVAKTKVRVILALLKELELSREMRGSRFRLLRRDVNRSELEELARRSEEKSAKDREKLERVMLYGQSAQCRWRLLHDYFGEQMDSERCGACDNCINPLEEQLGLTGGTEMPASGEKPHATKDADASEEKSTEVEFSKGDKVRLPQYGEGHVKEVDDDKVTVAFPDGEVRKFRKEFIRPQKIN
ncbi:MAG TPA: RecQ family zinc-binding domain-containing protein, partial [Pyrinomonadaceae bacterium]|nr:RecQ family zinc-binding domain-containing protein [Pyrinomonadaceae bacterium]